MKRCIGLAIMAWLDCFLQEEDYDETVVTGVNRSYS
jgi:hypothetical protein